MCKIVWSLRSESARAMRSSTLPTRLSSLAWSVWLGTESARVDIANVVLSASVHVSRGFNVEVRKHSINYIYRSRRHQLMAYVAHAE